jgi:hypothetical protein
MLRSHAGRCPHHTKPHHTKPNQPITQPAPYPLLQVLREKGLDELAGEAEEALKALLKHK